MQQRIRRFDVMQMATTLGALYFFLGIIIALCMWLFMGAIRGMTGGMGGNAGTGMMGGGIAMVVIAPLIYGVIGVIFGAITALLYNLVAGWTGGIGMDLE
jgi:hypothetical protein